MQTISTALWLYLSVYTRTRVVCFGAQIPTSFGAIDEPEKYAHNVWDLENDNRFIMNTYDFNAFANLHSKLIDTQLICLCIKICT